MKEKKTEAATEGEVVSKDMSTPAPGEVDPMVDMDNALEWQREFQQRSNVASAEIREILKKHDMDMIAQTKVLDVTIEIPISFKDLRQHSPAQSVPLGETIQNGTQA